MVRFDFRNSNIKHIVEMYIPASGAESGPPLGTVLGNIGLNSAKFCKDFNDFTKNLPIYFVVKVRILIMDNKTFSFIIYKPSSSYIFNLLKIKNKYYKIQNVYNIYFLEFIKVCIFRFPYSALNTSFLIL